SKLDFDSLFYYLCLLWLLSVQIKRSFSVYQWILIFAVCSASSIILNIRKQSAQAKVRKNRPTNWPTNQKTAGGLKISNALLSEYRCRHKYRFQHAPQP